ncbi:Late embryogenesis abundant protein [Klebsormidium nitens]|uniref:Late embryogenesis abundant protein n=1 Tax=Klebsormidium nitens TaxID=105231 RepID=A0A1Y1IQ44_KLENI|nr:Late embryogenesis abundant protein [Klebsormidium nitens]|eukprot:GAQ90258.1 Late embryogenesis abundant protein [Klebsormidium nitens]
MWEVKEGFDASESVRRLGEHTSTSEQTTRKGPPIRQPTKKKPPPLKARPSFNNTMGYMALGKSSRKMEESSLPGDLDSPTDDLEVGKRLEKLEVDASRFGGEEDRDEREENADPDTATGEDQEKDENGRAGTALENGFKHNREDSVDDSKGGLGTFDGIEDERGVPEKKSRGCVQHHRRALLCGGACCLIFVLLLGILALIGYLLFRPKEPGVKFNNLKVHQLRPNITPLPPKATLTFNVSGTLSLDNPNYFALTYYNTSAYILYRNTTLATVPVKEGHIPARSNRDIALSAIGRDFNVISKLRDLSSDLSRNRVPLTVNTFVPGRFSVLGTFGHEFQARISCNITVNPDSPNFRNVTLVDNSCTYKITL